MNYKMGELMKKNILISILLLLTLCIFAENSTQKELEQEYNRIYNRVKYCKSNGFCFDGKNKIKEVKEKAGENSFFIEKDNVYIKVYNKTMNKYFYSRHFELKCIKGKLVLEENYEVEPSISLKGHWSVFQIGNILSVTLCGRNTCKNFEVELYEINAKPISIQDGVFYEFKEADVKLAKNFKLKLNSKAKPDINIKIEKEEMNKILKKMSKYFTKKQIADKKKAFDSLIKNLN